MSSTKKYKVDAAEKKSQGSRGAASSYDSSPLPLVLWTVACSFLGLVDHATFARLGLAWSQVARIRTSWCPVTISSDHRLFSQPDWSRVLLSVPVTHLKVELTRKWADKVASILDIVLPSTNLKKVTVRMFAEFSGTKIKPRISRSTTLCRLITCPTLKVLKLDGFPAVFIFRSAALAKSIKTTTSTGPNLHLSRSIVCEFLSGRGFTDEQVYSVLAPRVTKVTLGSGFRGDLPSRALRDSAYSIETLAMCTSLRKLDLGPTAKFTDQILGGLGNASKEIHSLRCSVQIRKGEEGLISSDGESECDTDEDDDDDDSDKHVSDEPTAYRSRAGHSDLRWNEHFAEISSTFLVPRFPKLSRLCVDVGGNAIRVRWPR